MHRRRKMIIDEYQPQSKIIQEFEFVESKEEKILNHNKDGFSSWIFLIIFIFLLGTIDF